MVFLLHIDIFGYMNLKETALINSLLSLYESELRITDTLLADIQTDIERQLLLIFGAKEKHHYLSNCYTSTIREFQEMNLPEEITFKDLVSRKRKTIEEKIQNILKTNTHIFDNTKHELIFIGFISCCNEISSELLDIERKSNESRNITVKFIDDIISEAKDFVDQVLVELNEAIDQYSEQEYVDQEIIINYDNLKVLVDRVKVQLLDRFDKNFPSTTYNKLFVKSDSSIHSEKVVDDRKINLEGFQNLLSDIKKYSEEQLRELQTKQEYDLLYSLHDDLAERSILELIKKRETYHEMLLDVSQSPEGTAKVETRYLKSLPGYDQDFFEELSARLFKAGFIDGQGTHTQFANLFTGKPIKKKINWIGNRPKASMLYFMYLLFEKYKIVEYPSQPFPMLVNSFLLDSDVIERDTSAHDVLRGSYNKIRSEKYPGKNLRSEVEKVVLTTLKLKN